MGNKIEHYLRFGSHTETKIFNEIKNKNFGITFNANVIAHTPLAISKTLFLSLAKKDFFIDPQTYIYQLDPVKYYSAEKGNDVVLKKSVEALISEYKTAASAPLAKLAQPDYKTIKNALSELTINALKFQNDFLANKFCSYSNGKGYDAYSQLEAYSKGKKPIYLIPPYFYLTLDKIQDKSWEEWLDLNISAIGYAKKNTEIPKIAAEIVLDSKLLLIPDALEVIANKYNSIGVKTLMVWIDDFQQYEEEDLLKKYVQFLKRLKGKKISLYGSFFDLLLSKKNILSGFCHGPGYGEHRGVKPVGGGIPTAKFYLPLLFQRVRAESAEQVLSKKRLFVKETYLQKVCDCQKCRTAFKNSKNLSIDFIKYYSETHLSKKGRETPNPETLRNNQLHFIFRRLHEINHTTIESFNNEADEAIKWLERNNLIPYKHLHVWKGIINEK